MQKINLFFLLFIAGAASAKAQQSEAVLNYIVTYKDLAIEEMKRTGVPAAITLAQGIHESGAGKSKLATTSNNHFGIKCKTSWTGEKVYHDDDAKGECFRKYGAVVDSYKDHSDFLKNGQRYAFLFQLNPEDYSAWAYGLKQAGYATNPKYPQVLIKLIEDYGLQHYTMIGAGKVPDEFNKEVWSVQEGAMENKNPVVMQPPSEKKQDRVMEATAAVLIEKAATPAPEYPTGVFKINDTRVVFANKGTSFLALANQHHVDLFRLYEFNEITVSDFAEKDMLVYLQRKRKTGNDEYHIVKEGETLHDIAQQQGIRLEALQELNGLQKNSHPRAGTRLHLKGKAKTK